MIDTLADERRQDGDKILVVDMEHDAGLVYALSSNDPNGDFGNDNMGLHPNPTGYVKMGNRWYETLETFLPQFTEPTINSTAITTANINQPYTYQVTVAGSGPLTYSLGNGFPEGMTINEDGLIQWTPTESGSYNVTVQVANTNPIDHSQHRDSQPFTIEVNAQPPAGNVEITGQAALTTYVNTPITLTLDNLVVNDPTQNYPNGFTLTIYEGNDYTLNGHTVTPANGFSGRLSVPVIVSNGSTNSNGYTLSIDVLAEGAPVISGQATLKTKKNEALTITLDDLTVNDPSGQYPNGYHLTLNGGANYTVNADTITPSSGFTGTLSVPTKVSNGTLESNTYNLTIEVTNPNPGGGGGGSGCFIGTVGMASGVSIPDFKTAIVLMGLLLLLGLVIGCHRRLSERC